MKTLFRDIPTEVFKQSGLILFLSIFLVTNSFGQNPPCDYFNSEVGFEQDCANSIYTVMASDLTNGQSFEVLESCTYDVGGSGPFEYCIKLIFDPNTLGDEVEFILGQNAPCAPAGPNITVWDNTNGCVLLGNGGEEYTLDLSGGMIELIVCQANSSNDVGLCEVMMMPTCDYDIDNYTDEICSGEEFTFNLAGLVDGADDTYSYAVVSDDQTNIPAGSDRETPSALPITGSYTNNTGSSVNVTYYIVPHGPEKCMDETFTLTVTVLASTDMKCVEEPPQSKNLPAFPSTLRWILFLSVVGLGAWLIVKKIG